MTKWRVLVSVALAIGAAVFVLAWPMYATYGADGRVAARATLLEVNGSWSWIPVLFPVVVAVVPLLVRARAARILAAVLMTAFSLIGGMTIGLFYLPAAIAMAAAAAS